ncbi:MAG: peptide chain release factor 3, partial [Acidimicrobiia bacterium]|nr:peptide chain release factor 3 [Acidimicrobiia bacterium]
PALQPLELLDDIEAQLSLTPTPLSWPVGTDAQFRGVLDQRTGDFVRFTRTARGATIAPEEVVPSDRAHEEDGDLYDDAVEELGLLEAVGSSYDEDAFLAGIITPVFFGSALTNFGVRLLLDAVVDLTPAPTPKVSIDGAVRELQDPFSGFVFKVQANMDKAHRDRTAFFRVCSGRFERGMVVTHESTGRPLATKYAHTAFGTDRETLDEAYPGDIVGLVNANDVRIGDTLWDDAKVAYPTIPSFAPQHFAVARVTDTSRFKQFRNGVAQLDEEGVVQVLRDPDLGDQAPVLAAVGPMQFEVATHRLENEFGAPVELNMTNYQVARRTDAASTPELRAMQGVDVLERADGTRLALFESPYWLDRLLGDRPELVLEKLVASGS